VLHTFRFGWRLSSRGSWNAFRPNGGTPWGVCTVKLLKLTCVLTLGILWLTGCDDQSGSPLGSSPSSASGAPGSGIAELSWEAPTTDTNGSALTNLSGYRIYYGADKAELNQTVDINSVGMQTYVIDNLGTGTWYFAIKAITNTGVESALSSVVSKTI
jgi:hypothetical protein